MRALSAGAGLTLGVRWAYAAGVRTRPVNEHLVVCACAVERDGEYLLVRDRRDHVEGRGFPGALLDAGEDPADAAGRGVYDETGVHVRPDRLLGGYVDSVADAVEVVLVYGATVDADTTAESRDENIEAVEWFTPADLRGLDDLDGKYVYAAVSDDMSGEHHPRDLVMAL
jgi:ADP-ribose pyrophosphatase YjhB (NUDIX family)